MARILRLAVRYRVVALTIAIGVIGIILAVSGAGAAVPWVFSVYALAIAAWQAVGMVRDILRGHWGLDILAVTADPTKNISALRNIVMIMKGGTVYRNDLSKATERAGP